MKSTHRRIAVGLAAGALLAGGSIVAVANASVTGPKGSAEELPVRLVVGLRAGVAADVDLPSLSRLGLAGLDAKGSVSRRLLSEVRAKAIEVPSAWSAVDGSPVTDGSGTTWQTVSAAPDLDGYFSSWGVSGVSVFASPAAASASPDAIADTVVSGLAAEGCTSTGREPYEDGVHTGVWEVFTGCGGQATVVVVGAGALGPRMSSRSSPPSSWATASSATGAVVSVRGSGSAARAEAAGRASANQSARIVVMAASIRSRRDAASSSGRRRPRLPRR